MTAWTTATFRRPLCLALLLACEDPRNVTDSADSAAVDDDAGTVADSSRDSAAGVVEKIPDPLNPLFACADPPQLCSSEQRSYPTEKACAAVSQLCTRVDRCGTSAWCAPTGCDAGFLSENDCSALRVTCGHTYRPGLYCGRRAQCWSVASATLPRDAPCPEHYDCWLFPELKCVIPQLSVEACEAAGAHPLIDDGTGSSMEDGCPGGFKPIAWLVGPIEGGLCCEKR